MSYGFFPCDRVLGLRGGKANDHKPLVGADWNMTFIFSHFCWEVQKIPIDELICFRGVGIPPTRPIIITTCLVFPMWLSSNITLYSLDDNHWGDGVMKYDVGPPETIAFSWWVHNCNVTMVHGRQSYPQWTMEPWTNKHNIITSTGAPHVVQDIISGVVFHMWLSSNIVFTCYQYHSTAIRVDYH